MLKIKKTDEVWAFVECEPGQCQEISDLLTFEVPGAKFMPSYRNKYWDGKIRLFPSHDQEKLVHSLRKVYHRTYCQ